MCVEISLIVISSALFQYYGQRRSYTRQTALTITLKQLAIITCISGHHFQVVDINTHEDESAKKTLISTNL